MKFLFFVAIILTVVALCFGDEPIDRSKFHNLEHLESNTFNINNIFDVLLFISFSIKIRSL